MSPLLALALSASARAEAVIEFKTSGPVAILVDGQQATQMSSMRQRATGLEAGVHQLEISGMFGKKLYEAEIDVPDNTITYVSWDKGAIKVLKTEWLDEEEAEEEVAAEELPAEEIPTDVLAVAPPEAPIPGAAAAAPVAAAPVAPAVPAAPAAPVVPAAVPPVVAAVPAAVPAAPAAVPAPAGPAVAAVPEAPPELLGVPAAGAPPADAVAPVVAVAMPAAEPAVQALALPPPKSRTLTVQASDGMHIEVVNGSHKLVVVVEGSTFKIQDANGMSVAYSAE